MKEVSNLKDLMGFHLLSLYDAELHWSDTLKDSARAIASKELKTIFEQGSKTAASHAEKLKKIITTLGKTTLSKRKNLIAKDLAWEIKDLQDSAADPEVLDAALIVTQQCMNHYMIAKYGTLSSFARLLQLEDIAHSLHEIMEEEKKEDVKLTALAEENINIQAKTALIL